MKMVIYPPVSKKMVIKMGGLMIVAMLTMMLGHEYLLQARVDRTTAMQVASPVTVEQVIPANSPDFFIEYRLEREKIRSERSDLLRESIKQAQSDDARTHAQDIVLKMIMEKQKETEMESLIKARGFTDSLVFIRDDSVNAIIKSNSLSREEVIQIADVISRVSGVKIENISISAKP